MVVEGSLLAVFSHSSSRRGSVILEPRVKVRVVLHCVHA